MPIEGVSFQNSGFQNVTPAEVADQAKDIAKQDSEKKIKEPEKSDETKPESDENEEENRDLQGRDTSDDDSEENEDDSEKIKEFLQNEKKYSVKFNSSTEMVEMIDIASGNILETIAPEELINFFSNSKAFAGIFVDRKI